MVVSVKQEDDRILVICTWSLWGTTVCRIFENWKMVCYMCESAILVFGYSKESKCSRSNNSCK